MIDKILNDETLLPKHKDHKLRGQYAGYKRLPYQTQFGFDLQKIQR